MVQELSEIVSDQSTSGVWRRAIVYMVWGADFIHEAMRSASSAAFMGIPLVLITDTASQGFIPDKHPFSHIQLVEKFRSTDYLNKSTLWDHLPQEFNSFLYLDTDTVILKEVTFGFGQAEKHGIAASQATSYCLPSHHEFRRIMLALGLSDAGQLQYNAGVYFFIRRPDVEAVFKLYQEMAYALSEQFDYRNRASKRTDQPFLSLAMERLNFNPYTLSINYCYRGIDAEPVCGDIRIWHSHHPVPKSVNHYESFTGPRRRYRAGKAVDMRPIYWKSRMQSWMSGLVRFRKLSKE
jgi:hypothetical protein